MNIRVSSLLSAAALACVGLMSATPALAQGTFTGAGTGSTCDPGSGSFDTVSCTKGSVTVTMTAWGYNPNPTTTAATGWQQGRLGDFNTAGFGAYTGSNESTNGSQHAFDSLTSGCGTGSGASGGSVALSTANSGCGGYVEGMLLNFGTAKVNISALSQGFYSSDADLSLWVWTGGSGAPSMTGVNLATSTTGAGSMSGWTLVGSNDMDAVNPWSTGGSLYSSYFLITTYFGATVGALDKGNDAFKINSFTANVCAGTLSGGTGGNGASCNSVPEPGSLALVGLAMVGGMVATRRRGRALR